ncbi:MAG: YcbK family protein [Myxococcales bacterium]|nr:YcbK family protein [Myxococcales bacterium]
MRSAIQGLLGVAVGASLVLLADVAIARVSMARAIEARSAPSLGRLPPPRTLDAPPVHHEREARKEPPSHAPAETLRADVTFFNLHTRELLGVGAATPDPAALSRFLRCRVTYDETTIDPTPVVVAYEMATRFGASRVEIVSGYRSPKMNEMLRKKEREVAATSRHMSGEALDFRVVGVDARTLAGAVAEGHVGGIGTYPISNFVHVDVGPNRRWRGR